MAGIHNEILYGRNMDFRGVWPPVGQVTQDGQLFIGSSVAPFLRAGLLTSTGGTIDWTFGPGTINAEVNTFPFDNWQEISADQSLLVANGYFCVSPGGDLNLTLPATSNIGDSIEVALDGANSFTIKQLAGQQIRMGSVTTTLGTGGSILSERQGDSIRLVCRVANTLWFVVSNMGILSAT